MARGDGLRVRFSRISGETNKETLKQPLWLPATLGDVEVSEDATHRDYETVSAGEFSVPGGGKSPSARKLRRTDLETLTVAWDAPWLVERNGRSPQEVYLELRNLLRYRRGFEVLASLRLDEPEPELRMDATLRSVSRVLRFGQNGIRYYTISLVEWRDASLKRKTSDTSQAKDGKRLPTKHKLREGTTLRALSKLYYGTYVGWEAIARENGIKRWGGNTPLVKMKKYKIGDEVKIPIRPPEAEPMNVPGESGVPAVAVGELFPIAGESVG